jgi:drug/metabolite transporter (DMT)-like permease
MQSTLARYFLVLICVFGISFGQVLFKKISTLIHAGAGVASMRVIYLFVLAAALYGGATVLWIWALRGVELSRAYLFMALCFVLVPGMSWYFFGEPISAGYLLGTMLIVLGILVAVRFG